MGDHQIYSATYSNVPVFEFVTEEGPIMRRKKDSWINATHILKIAKFPKAKRTRILEKDVQTGTHEKVQGGYGKYQGTYVPLGLGIDLARTFGVYEELKPIFDFKYIEGKSDTPPPAPKHNHASASTVANRNNSDLVQARKSKSTNSINEPPRKRGRPKRVPLDQPPTLTHSDTQPVDVKLTRQDTERDALNLMASNMNHHIQSQQATPLSSMNMNGRRINANIKDEDLELDNSSENEDEEEFLTGKELFGTPRNSFERIVNHHNNHSFRTQQLNYQGLPISAGPGPTTGPTSVGNATLITGYRNNSHDPYGLSQYHHPQQNNHLQSFKDDPHNEYFTNLLNFFLEDNQQGQSQSTEADEEEEKDEKVKKPKDTVIPEALLTPPQPIAKININQPIDNDGNSIFHWACSMGNYTIIEFLINNFPNIINSNIKNNNGETPLMFLIKFSNSYQLKNFPSLLDLLVDSLFSVDNYNKTVLHHIAISVTPPSSINERSFVGNEEAQLTNYLKNKERIARYYIECLFSKIIEFQNNDSSNELIKKFINHQDTDGNTAFHLIAYNLNKKLIKVFISYHKFIDFNIKNLVNYSAEEYLASHNYILKLESDEPIKINDALVNRSLNIHSFESQLYYSKMTVNLTNSTSNLITEKLTELNFLIDKELNEKDESLLKLINLNNKLQTLKLYEQKMILKIFKLDYLIKDVEADMELIDLKRDKIIQDEINRFVNDLTFQVLQKKEKLDAKFKLYKTAYLKFIKDTIGKEKSFGIETVDNFELAVALQKEIIKSNKMMDKLIDIQAKIPLNTNVREGNKENNANGAAGGVDADGVEDKLSKYCKLISLCCGMDINEVESSIDSIEHSLMKSMNQT